jgi:hypothetical protein
MWEQKAEAEDTQREANTEEEGHKAKAETEDT